MCRCVASTPRVGGWGWGELRSCGQCPCLVCATWGGTQPNVQVAPSLTCRVCQPRTLPASLAAAKPTARSTPTCRKSTQTTLTPKATTGGLQNQSTQSSGEAVSLRTALPAPAPPLALPVREPLRGRQLQESFACQLFYLCLVPTSLFGARTLAPGVMCGCVCLVGHLFGHTSQLARCRCVYA